MLSIITHTRGNTNLKDLEHKMICEPLHRSGHRAEGVKSGPRNNFYHTGYQYVQTEGLKIAPRIDGTYRLGDQNHFRL
jgi:hypothetical protein